jgi:hypothetical protein
MLKQIFCKKQGNKYIQNYEIYRSILSTKIGSKFSRKVEYNILTEKIFFPTKKSKRLSFENFISFQNGSKEQFLKLTASAYSHVKKGGKKRKEKSIPIFEMLFFEKKEKLSMTICNSAFG